MSDTRKLAAILVSDVVGFTSRLAGADEDRILAWLLALQRSGAAKQFKQREL